MNAFFAFSGQGAQAVGMGKDLYETSPAAKAVFDEADSILGYRLSGICFEGPAEDLTRTIHCQTAIYTMSCAALAAFRELYPEVKPVCCAGLSLGEYGALCAGGAFSFAEGLRILRRRAELMDEACNAADGTMAPVINGDPELIREICARHDIDVANLNCPGQIVISGSRPGVEASVADLKAAGVRKAMILKVAGAFHSRMMAQASSGT